MSAVRARFYVAGYQMQAYDPEAVNVTLQAVSRGEHNKDWAKYTPSGQITMTIKNPGAASWFTDRLGQEVAVTFEPVDSDAVFTDAHGAARPA